MDGVVYVALDITHEAAQAPLAWERAPLAPLRDALRGTGDFDALLADDVDHVEATTTVADVLARLERSADEGAVYFSREPARTRGAARVGVRGVLATWSDYHEALLPLIYVAAAAAATGSRARLSVMGDLEGTVLIVLVDVEDGAVTVRSEDPQNLAEPDWRERLGDTEALDAAYQKWARKGRRRRR